MTSPGRFVVTAFLLLVSTSPTRADFLTVQAGDSLTRANPAWMSPSGNIMLASTAPANVRMAAFMKFDLSALPDDAIITGLKLTTYSWNPTGLIPPIGNPQLQIYRSDSDAWSRGGTLPPYPGTNQALTAALTGFPTGHRQAYEWMLNPLAADWSADLADDSLTLVMRNMRNSTSSASWYGSGGNGVLGYDPNGEYAPTLEIEYSAPSVPEPTTLALAGIGLAGVIGMRRRRKV